MTLAELLIAMLIMAVLLGSTLTFLESAARTVGTSSKEIQSLDGARVALARIEHELRVASVVQQTGSCPTTATCLVMTVPVAGGTQGVRYRYDTDAKTLYRAIGDPLLDTWGAEAPAVRDVVNGASVAVFCRSNITCTTPSEVGATQIVLRINTDPTHPSQVFELRSYVTPRNL